MKIIAMIDNKQHEVEAENIKIGDLTLREYMERLIAVDNKVSKIETRLNEREKKLTEKWKLLTGGKN